MSYRYIRELALGLQHRVSQCQIKCKRLGATGLVQGLNVVISPLALGFEPATFQTQEHNSNLLKHNPTPQKRLARFPAFGKLMSHLAARELSCNTRYGPKSPTQQSECSSFTCKIVKVPGAHNSALS